MPFLIFFTLFIVTIFSVFLQPAQADTITMLNGDRFTGKILKVQEGRLYLKTPYADNEFIIQWRKIATLESDSEVTVQLDSGEILTGVLRRSETDRQLRVETQLTGVENIDWKDIRSINPPGEKPVQLEGSILLGGTHASGNTDRAGFSVAIDGVRKARRHRFNLGILGNYSEENNEVSARNAFGRLKYDYFFTEKFYGYLSTELLYDKFKDLNLRTVVGPGIGYQFWDDDIRSLAFEGGIAYYNEDRNEAEDASWITGRFACLFSYKFSTGTSFSEKLTLYPSFENVGEYTLRNEASISSPIAFGWSLQLKNILEHDSEPKSPDVEKTDSLWIFGLNYNF